MAGMKRLRWTLFVALAAVVASGLAYRSWGARPGEASASPVSQAGTSQAPFDVKAIMRQVHFAYQPERDGWRGGHSTYDVKATTQGLTLTPVRHKAVASKELEEETAVETGAPLFLGAARVSRGDLRLSVEAPRGNVQGDGHLAFMHGALAEHLRNSEQGVEQSWSFEQAPEGHGDLQVTIPVKGLSYTRTSEQGLHFADARTGLGFQYGHGTWVDGKGRRTPVRAEYAQGEIRLRVPEQVLAESAYPAVLDPLVSYEMIIDGRLTAADTTRRREPSVAFNGTNYLVVWTAMGGQSITRIYGARVSSTGTLLDPAGIVLSSGPGSSSYPEVASNGTDFYVIWVQAGTRDVDGTLRGTRVQGSGVVDLPGGEVLTRGYIDTEPEVASNGTDYLVVWSAYVVGQGYYELFAQRRSSTGQAMDSQDILIAATQSVGSNSVQPSVASNGTMYLVAWTDWRDTNAHIYACRISNAGVSLDGTGFRVSNGGSDGLPDVASNGTNFFVAWTAAGGLFQEIYGARVTDTGTLVDGGFFLLSDDPGGQEYAPAVSSNGTDYLVVWEIDGSTNNGLHASRISATDPWPDAVVDTPSLVVAVDSSTDQFGWAAVAPAGSGYFVLSEVLHNGSSSQWQSDLGSVWISSSGAVSAGGNLATTSLASLSQTEPVVAAGGNFLVVWTDTTSSGIRIRGARVSRTGVLLDPSGLQITSTAGRERQSPAVTSNGQDFFVTWQDYRNGNWDIYGARVSGSGTVLDPEGFVVSADPATQNYAAVGSNGTDYLVVWRQDPGGRADVYGARVTSAGVVQDPSGIAIATNVAEHYTPRVAFNGTQYLVVWAEYLSATNWDVHGTRVTSAGSVVDTPSLVIYGASGDQYDPDVTSDGTNFLVVWTDNANIYGARVSGAGAVLDTPPLALCTHTAAQSSPRVSFDGVRFVAAWADYRSSSAWDVYGTGLSTTGTVLTPGGFSVFPAVSASTPALSLASIDGNSSFAVFSNFDTEPGQGNRRVKGVFISGL